MAPDCSLVLLTTPRPARVALHEFNVKDLHLRASWGNRLYQVRLCFDAVGSQGRCDTLLVARRGGTAPASGADAPLEIEELP